LSVSYLYRNFLFYYLLYFFYCSLGNDICVECYIWRGE
jgi:hypothetical protein